VDRLISFLALALPVVLNAALAAPGALPARIVALAPSAAEILFALGAKDRVVGVSDAAADLPGAAGKERVGGFTPDLERVVSLRPDLVVVSRDGTDRAAWERLERTGLRVVVTRGTTLEAVLADIRLVGDAIGDPAGAERLVAALRARIAAAEARAVLGRGPRRRALVVIWPDPPVVAGPATFIGDLLARAGFQNAAPEGSGEWPRVSFETLAAWNPDLLVRPDTKDNSEVFRRAFLGDARWRLVRAAREGRILALPGDWLERPGPRLVDALEALAAAAGEAPR
jgi:iron complex transport system substrate-binding protein